MLMTDERFRGLKEGELLPTSLSTGDSLCLMFSSYYFHIDMKAEHSDYLIPNSILTSLIDDLIGFCEENPRQINSVLIDTPMHINEKAIRLKETLSEMWKAETPESEHSMSVTIFIFEDGSRYCTPDPSMPEDMLINHEIILSLKKINENTNFK